jgi:hypothetical protein
MLTTEHTIHECEDCDWKGPQYDMAPIDDMCERVQTGELHPVGQCPECGSLIGATDDDVPDYTVESCLRIARARGMLETPRVLLTIEGGALQKVDADSPCRVLLIDFDTQGCDEEDLLAINGSTCTVTDYRLTGDEKDAQNAVRGAFLLAKVTP